MGDLDYKYLTTKQLSKANRSKFPINNILYSKKSREDENIKETINQFFN